MSTKYRHLTTVDEVLELFPGIYKQRTTDFPTYAPLCRRCNKRATSKDTKKDNPNGNAGRQYYECLPCNNYLGFADARGNDRANSDCKCEPPISRKRLLVGHWDESNKNSRAGQVFYVCRHGKSGFHKFHETTEKEFVVIDGEELIAELGR
ncbi:hypothetical protein F4813DRAFT_384701 [Daldinia decipiens]|uniref:uncharacterized protein n=1 Tax=Daldinia decipiens TaxID=326647 RepID=UPI0020C35F30|nr:uncharacterized protein F4813DRAFT_384701 [Daldinia decipiens]KAI1661986.1 hypothetical protein F4813DRAFT_384701 [Daldinia decipiens]